jgi:hypothetical protein
MGYSSYSFSTPALDGGEWSASRPGRTLAPGKVPTVQEAGWTLEPVWTQRLHEKSFRLCRGSNTDRPVLRPVARHYTAWATRLPCAFSILIKQLNTALYLRQENSTTAVTSATLLGSCLSHDFCVSCPHAHGHYNAASEHRINHHHHLKACPLYSGFPWPKTKLHQPN